MRQGGGGDPEVVRADELPVRRQLSPDVGVNTRDGLGDLDRSHAGEQMLDEGASASSLRAARSVHPLQELADRDDADRPVFVTDCRLDLGIGDTALEVDEQVGVDQDGHASSGGPADSRAMRTSPAKSGSSGGALAMSSRNRSAPISRDFDGEMTATAAPLRVSSISSPPATLLSTSEKLREASVAVMRITAAAYQINLMMSSLSGVFLRLPRTALLSASTARGSSSL